MERVFEFLRENPLQYCATIGLDGKPKVRPFQMMYNEGGKIFYCTGAKKDVYAELQKNPYLEISVSTMEKWLRIRVDNPVKIAQVKRDIARVKTIIREQELAGR